MKSKIIALILCFCILVSVPVSTSAQDYYDPTNPDVFTTTSTQDPTEPSDTTTPIPNIVDLLNCNVKLAKTNYVYSAEEKTPKVTVTYGDFTYLKDIHYTVEYVNNINAGTATVNIKAIEGNDSLSGSASREFTIAKKDISVLKNKQLSQTDYVYDGTAHTPVMTMGITMLPVLNVDYTLSYKKNVNIGFGQVTAKGIGNYTGKVTKTFKIHPKKVEGVSASSVKDTTFTLKWKAVSGKIDGYRIYRYDPSKSKYVFAVATKSTYFYVKARTPATIYRYKVRAYKTVDGKRIESEDSNVRTVVMRPKQVVTLASGYTGKSFTFKWEKQKADGYEIRYSKYKNMKKGVNKKTVNNNTKNSLKVKLNKNTQYYYQVRAYKDFNGKKYYGVWSEKRTTRFANVYSSFYTYFSSPYGRTVNVKLASKHIDGTVLEPGDVFSFDSVVGPRTPERGFKIATVYQGEEVTEGYGGGVCQVSTTLFNAVLYANLEIVERHQHTLPVHYVPYGRDAAISWGTCDFRFKNSTKYAIKISAKVISDSKIEFKLLTNAEAKPKKVTLSVSSSGKHHILYRKVDGKVNYTTHSWY